MGNRGRQSTSSLAIVPPREVLERGRPEPPKDLTAEQAVEWRAIVRRMPADWFPRETHGLLADYCRHVLRSRKIATLIDRVERTRTVDVDDYDKLAKMADRESRTIASLATKMRISQHASYDRKKAKGAAAARPWEDQG